MNPLTDTVTTIEPVPSPALANTRRDKGNRVLTGTERSACRPSFESILQSSWYRAARHGFTPGEEREYLLEAEFANVRRWHGTGDG